MSAVERTPTKIWQDIFSFVLWTWLLPNDDNTVFEDAALLQGGCESTLEYRRIEDIRIRLRSVCRSWRAILDDLSVDRVVSEFCSTADQSEYHLSRAKVIEFPPTRLCRCRRCPYRIPERTMKYYSERVDISDGIIPKFDSPFKPGRARVILLGDAERDIMDYLQHAPLLTAFAGGFSLLDISSRTATHSFLARLTHLSLHHMSVKQTVIALHLPRVRFLRIELTLREDEKPPETLIPFDSWVVPNLASLIIRGNTGKAYYQDFLRFLYRHSSTVEHLVMHLYTLFHGDLTFYRLDIHSLQRFPHLKGLGLGVIKDTKNLDTVDEDIPMRLSLLIILLEASFSTRFIITLLGSTHEAPRPRGTGDG